eukprot:3456387-Amphidinium_carterae.1
MRVFNWHRMLAGSFLFRAQNAVFVGCPGAASKKFLAPPLLSVAIAGWPSPLVPLSWGMPPAPKPANYLRICGRSRPYARASRIVEPN